MCQGAPRVVWLILSFCPFPSLCLDAFLCTGVWLPLLCVSFALWHDWVPPSHPACSLSAPCLPCVPCPIAPPLGCSVEVCVVLRGADHFLGSCCLPCLGPCSNKNCTQDRHQPPLCLHNSALLLYLPVRRCSNKDCAHGSSHWWRCRWGLVKPSTIDLWVPVCLCMDCDVHSLAQGFWVAPSCCDAWDQRLRPCVGISLYTMCRTTVQDSSRGCCWSNQLQLEINASTYLPQWRGQKRDQNWTLQGGPLLISRGSTFWPLFETRFLCTGVQNWTLNRLNPVPPWRSGFKPTSNVGWTRWNCRTGP